MADDEATRKVKAVRRGSRRAADEAPLGLLPPEALSAKCFRFLERFRGVGLTVSSSTPRYEVQLGDHTPVLLIPRRSKGWVGRNFEVRDLDDAPRFTLRLGLHKLVMHEMSVLTPQGEELGRLEQRFSLMEVKFDISNPDGSLRFTLFQPAGSHSFYDVNEGALRVARIAKDRGAPVQGMRDLLEFKDAFRVDLESPSLGERDRVLLIAAAILMDRVFHTSGDR